MSRATKVGRQIAPQRLAGAGPSFYERRGAVLVHAPLAAPRRIGGRRSPRSPSPRLWGTSRPGLRRPAAGPFGFGCLPCSPGEPSHACCRPPAPAPAHLRPAPSRPFRGANRRHAAPATTHRTPPRGAVATTTHANGPRTPLPSLRSSPGRGAAAAPAGLLATASPPCGLGGRADRPGVAKAASRASHPAATHLATLVATGGLNAAAGRAGPRRRTPPGQRAAPGLADGCGRVFDLGRRFGRLLAPPDR
jgi:hypothetical protein